MIGYLKGKILKINGNTILLDVNNVGYKILVTNNLSSSLKFNDVTEIYTYTYVREDQLALFGFKKYEDLEMFEMLLGVSGIGPKSALSIITALSTDEIIKAIRNAKVDEFTKISGLGKKGAQKIIMELQGKVGKVTDLSLKTSQSDSELIEALENLGFSQKEAIKMSSGIDHELPLQQKIKISLKKR